MEITFKNTAEDYRSYWRLSFHTQFAKRLLLSILYPLLAGVAAAGKPPNWTVGGITALITAILLFILFWFIPYFQSLKMLRQALRDSSFTEKQKIKVTEEGLQTEAASGPSLFRYESILSVEQKQEFVVVTLIGRKSIFIPDTAFGNTSERINFIGTLRNSMSGARSKSAPKSSNKPSLYILGAFSLMPLIGAFIGAWLFLSGIYKYKDKRYVIVGAAGIIFSIALYFYQPADRLMKKPVRAAVQTQLDNLVKEIEFFKIQQGTYPDSLQQLQIGNPSIQIYELLHMPDNRRQTFNYCNMETGYHLYSAGEDGMPDTQDDIYPRIPPQQGKLGLLRPER